MAVGACGRARGSGGGGGVGAREDWKGGQVGREEKMGVKDAKKHFRGSFSGVRTFSCRCEALHNFLRLYTVLPVASLEQNLILWYQSVPFCHLNPVTHCPVSAAGVSYTLLCSDATVKNSIISVVCVCEGCHGKILQTGWFKQQLFMFSQFWRPEVQDQSVGRFRFL